ncbi:MAG: hypothetical protein ACXWAC_14630 [Usitatibacter sp.]
MAANFAEITTDDFALRSSGKLGTATLLVTLLFSLATVAAMHAPIHVDETGFEASAAAE